jgi:ABC-type glycerol-3-phosphate transport system substrate-binding protein
MTRNAWRALALLAVLVLALAAAGCGGDDDDEGGEGAGTTTTAEETTEEEQVSGTVSVMGIWVGEEQASFKAVIDGFKDVQPDVTVKYNPVGDNLPTVLSTAVQGGNPPDIAAIAQPGLMTQFVDQGKLQALDSVQDAVVENFGQSVVDTGTVENNFYGLLWKANNASTVWYNVAAFEDAGVEPPTTWDEFLEAADTIKASGLPAFSIAGADGWTLTDLFENIYLRTAGAEKYDQLSRHEIPWTDQSVKDALTEMAKVFSDGDNLAGGRSGAQQADFPTSVSNVFAAEPKASMVIEADFVPGVVQTTLKPETGYNFFAFPSINDSPPAVVAKGNLVIAFRDTPAVQAFLDYLVSPESAEIWVKRGGFASPNKNVPAASYSDALLRETSQTMTNAETLRFDLADLQPSAFGATVGQGLWKLFQDLLKNPDNVDGIARQMEAAAAKAFK